MIYFFSASGLGWDGLMGLLQVLCSCKKGSRVMQLWATKHQPDWVNLSRRTWVRLEEFTFQRSTKVPKPWWSSRMWSHVICGSFDLQPSVWLWLCQWPQIHTWSGRLKPLWSRWALWTGPDPPEPAQCSLAAAAVAVAAVNSDLCRITPSACSAGRVFSMKRGSAFS